MPEEFPIYHVYHPEMAQHLHKGLPPFFFNFVDFNYSIFASQYKCTVTVNPARMLDAFDGWQRDQRNWLREMNETNGTTRLDHFKHAALIAYWLRRRVVVDHVQFMENPAPLPEGYVSPLQEFFASHSSEICSFLLGLHLCIRYEFDRNSHVLESDGLDEDYVQTIATLLKRKELSPQSLFLIYKSLFRPLPFRRRTSA